MTVDEMETALRGRYEDLYVTNAAAYRGGNEWQVCDGCGRDGFVMASASSRNEAIKKAYSERIDSKKEPTQ